MVTLFLDYENTNEYQSLVSDLVSIHTESVFNSRWELIVGYHKIGERIVTDIGMKWNARGNGSTLSRLSKSTGIHERDLRRAIQFYNRYPNLDLLPEGKNISWNKIVNGLLPEHSGAPAIVRNWNFYAPQFSTMCANIIKVDDAPEEVKDAALTIVKYFERN